MRWNEKIVSGVARISSATIVPTTPPCATTRVVPSMRRNSSITGCTRVQTSTSDSPPGGRPSESGTPRLRASRSSASFVSVKSRPSHSP